MFARAQHRLLTNNNNKKTTKQFQIFIFAAISFILLEYFHKKLTFVAMMTIRDISGRISLQEAQQKDRYILK